MPTITWLEILKEHNPDAEIIWYTGIDSVIPQAKYGGKCEIEANWHRGSELIKNYKFLILPRTGYPDPQDIKIPLANYEILNVKMPNICSTEIRQLIAQGNPRYKKMVSKQVYQYINEHKLYQEKKISFKYFLKLIAQVI